MAGEQFLTLLNTSPNRLINRAYKDTVFRITGEEQIDEIYGGVTDFKYHLFIYIDGVKKAELKSPTGYFHIEQIIQDHTETDNGGYAVVFNGVTMPESKSENVSFSTRPHSIHSIDKFALNRDNFKMVELKIGASFFNEVGIDGGLSFQSASEYSKNKYTFNRYYFWNACQQWKDGDVTEYVKYILDGTGKQFLTNQVSSYYRRVRRNDFHTFAFFNGRFCQSANQGHGHFNNPCESSLVRYLYVTLHDAGGNVITNGWVENNEDNGGAFFPDLNGVAQHLPYNLNPLDKALLYVGVGPQNIIGSWDREGGGLITANDFTNCNFYKITALGSLNIGDKHSKTYHFRIQDDDCKGYETVRLAYLNEQGAWDYMNFTKKSTISTDITRSNYKQNYGYAPIGLGKGNFLNGWEYGKYEGGTRTYNVNAIDTYEANSDWLDEVDAEFMKELFYSPDVYRMDNVTGEFYPVVVTEKDYTLQTKANDKLIQYVITVQDGHANRIQRL